MTTPDQMDVLLQAIGEVYRNTPALAEFEPWPSEFERADPGFQDIPCRTLVEGFSDTGIAATEPVIEAIRNAAGSAFWLQTYTEEEVGRDFLNRYGYFEVFGPTETAHFKTDGLSGYVGYWGDGLNYDWHNHEAIELYYCLAGEALFKLEGDEDKSMTAGDARLHKSFQKHALDTRDKPFLCLAFWRGKGLADLPMMAS